MECTRRRLSKVRAVFSTHYTTPFPLEEDDVSHKSPARWFRSFKSTGDSPLRLVRDYPLVRCRRLKSIGVRMTLSPKHQPTLHRALRKVDRSTSIGLKDVLEKSSEHTKTLISPLSLHKVLKVREMSQPFLSPWEGLPSSNTHEKRRKWDRGL